MKREKQTESTSDELLREDGTLAEAEALAVKRVIAWQVKETMTRKNKQSGDGKKDEHQPRGS